MGACIREQRGDQSRKLLELLYKETIHLWKIDKTKEFGTERVNGEEVTRKITVSLTRFVCTDFLAPNSLCVWWYECVPFSCYKRAPFTGEFISCFQEEKAGQSTFFYTCCFSSAFNSKWSVCGNMLWTPVCSSKWIMHLNVRTETTTSKRKCRRKSLWLWISLDFFFQCKKQELQKKNNHKLIFIIIKHLKDTIKNMKKPQIERKYLQNIHLITGL